jgi:serine protease AprX
MKRNRIETLIYSGRTSRRFTQDTPILPDVWIEYAVRPGEAKRLLLTPWQGPGRFHTTPGLLSIVVRQRLRAERSRAAAAPKRRRRSKPTSEAQRAPVQVAYNNSTVLVDMTFDELIRVVLPLSDWWHTRVVEDGHQEKFARLRTLADDKKFLKTLDEPSVLLPRRKVQKSASAPGATGGVDSTSHDNHQWPAHLLWMIRIIGSIALANRAELDHRKLPDEWPPLREDGGEPPPEMLAHLREVVLAVADLFDGIDTETTSVTGHDEDMAGVPDEVHVHSVSLNRPAATTLRDSRMAVKADAADKLFTISCRELSWVVVDSGIDARHPAFRARDKDGKAFAEPFGGGANHTRITATYDFTLIQYLLSADDAVDLPANKELRGRLDEIHRRIDAGRRPKASKTDKHFLEEYERLKRSLLKGRAIDWTLLLPFITVPQVNAASYQPPTNEHGTHVAGIIGADWRTTDTDDTVYEPTTSDVTGIARDINLYDFRVLDEQGHGDEFNVIAALQFLRFLKAQKDYMALHGVNLSLSIRHDVANYACGCTPVCDECERLVGSGIVVVAAAGNDGYKQFLTAKGDTLDSFHSISITDPGNAEGVITVGSTHRLMPHTYGVSYFSSRGPTGDGRAKPDLVAPGEKITAPAPDGTMLTLDGTSMAAPHVSGAVALLIARHRELSGQPARIKKILRETATDLGRERYFQGSGMVDVLRAIQSV